MLTKTNLMKTKLLTFSVFLLLMLTSCVSTEDLTYLRNKSPKIENQVIEAAKPYRLQVNDVVTVNIKTVDEKLVEIFNSNKSTVSPTVENVYFSGYTVDDHGNIRLPVLGEINVLGNTVEEARIKVETKLLSDYFKKEAQLFVSVKLAGFRFAANGEVNSPGSKVLYQDRVNILEALANVGDITITGDRKDVKVLRQFPGGIKTYSIDLTDANAIYSPVFFLQPNDLIYVKPLKQKSWGTGGTGKESLATIITALSLVTTIFLILKN